MSFSAMLEDFDAKFMIDPRQFLLDNFHAAVSAVTPLHVLPAHIPDFPKTGRVFVLALGKAAEEMAQVALGTLQNKPGFDPSRFSALAVIRQGDKLPHSNEMIDVIEAAHPRPDESSAAAAEELLKRARFATKDDLVLCLISGGGSSLTMCPAEGLSWQQLQAANDALLKGGVPIDKMNTLRKHISRFSGGRLRLAANARVITLAISDVPGDDLSVIASGPTVFDASTFNDALNVIRDFKLNVPPEVLNHLQRGAKGEVEETLKPNDPRVANDIVKVIASSDVAMDAGDKHAALAGLMRVNQGVVEGEAHDVATRMAVEIKEFAKTCTKPTLFISGGELTVTMAKGATPGMGGRNSRFILALMKALQGTPNVHAIACGTDGIDYVTYAGAVMTDQTFNEAKVAKLDADDYLNRYDSHTFFEKLNALVKTNATHTNVGDYRAILVLPRA